MNRTRRTAANVVTQAAAVTIQSIFALIVAREIIANIGSDYNGINSTATQVLGILSLIEGGFTLATLVCLYKPYNNNDIKGLNQYLSLSRMKFRRIGLLYLVVGILIAVAYAPFIKTEADIFTTTAIMVLSVISSSFTILYSSKYRLIYQVSQSEYLLFIIQAVVNIVMYSIEIILIRLTRSIVWARVCVTSFQILSGLIMGGVARKKFPFISFKESFNSVSIPGTGDVIFSKVAGLIYSSSTVLFISTFMSTALTSVYAVYNSVLSLIGNYINGCLTAPRNAFGQLMHNDNINYQKLRDLYNEYEYIAILAVALLYSTTMALIIPFVRIYITKIADINYIDFRLAILLVLVFVTQMIHIPSGTCIEISGRFKAVKVIQGIAAVTLLCLSIVGAWLAGLYGILLAKLITNVMLASLEITYARRIVLKSSVWEFMRINSVNITIGGMLAFVEFNFFSHLEIDLFKFAIYGTAVFGVNGVVLLAYNMLFHRKMIQNVYNRSMKIIKNR